MYLFYIGLRFRSRLCTLGYEMWKKRTKSIAMESNSKKEEETEQTRRNCFYSSSWLLPISSLVPTFLFLSYSLFFCICSFFFISSLLQWCFVGKIVTLHLSSQLWMCWVHSERTQGHCVSIELNNGNINVIYIHLFGFVQCVGLLLVFFFSCYYFAPMSNVALAVLFSFSLALFVCLFFRSSSLLPNKNGKVHAAKWIARGMDKYGWLNNQNK